VPPVAEDRIAVVFFVAVAARPIRYGGSPLLDCTRTVRTYAGLGLADALVEPKFRPKVKRSSVTIDGFKAPSLTTSSPQPTVRGLGLVCERHEEKRGRPSRRRPKGYRRA